MRFKILTNCWINFPGAISGGDGESRTVWMRSSWFGKVWSNKETSLSEVADWSSTAKSLLVKRRHVRVWFQLLQLDFCTRMQMLWRI